MQQQKKLLLQIAQQLKLHKSKTADYSVVAAHQARTTTASGASSSASATSSAAAAEDQQQQQQRFKNTRASVALILRMRTRPNSSITTVRKEIHSVEEFLTRTFTCP